jgi:hypothetical protein
MANLDFLGLAPIETPQRHEDAFRGETDYGGRVPREKAAVQASSQITEKPADTMEIIPNINTAPPAEPPTSLPPKSAPSDKENKKTITPLYYSPNQKGGAAVKQAQANATFIQTQLVAAEKAALAGIDMTSNWPANLKTAYDKKQMQNSKNKVNVKNAYDYRVIQQQQEMIKQNVPTMSLVPTSAIDSDTAYSMPREYDKTINGNALNPATVSDVSRWSTMSNAQKIGLVVAVCGVVVGVVYYYKYK